MRRRSHRSATQVKTIDPAGAAAVEPAPVSGALAGKSAVVTGASSGIGAATARALAGAGAAVTVGARRAARLEALAAELCADGAAVALQPTDMRREDDVCRLIGLARERFGGVDILVNNAGLGRAAPLGP